MSDTATPDDTDGQGTTGALPIAVVVVDTPLAHLDRPFEYLVPDELLDAAVPGVRVKVRFAGRDLDGFVIARRATPEHAGRLAPLRSVVSAEPVLTEPVLALCRAVADRYAGALSDVLRLAVPKRHARAEQALPLHPPTKPADDASSLAAQGSSAAPETSAGAAHGSSAASSTSTAASSVWNAYPAGAAFLRRVESGAGPWAAWRALPGQIGADEGWPTAMAAAVAAAHASGRGAVVVVPDHRDVDRLDAALSSVLGPGQHVRLTADQGQQARYTAWLKVLRGHVRVAIGTRAAAFAPVHELGLVAWWDDGDDLLDEPRAPYQHVREVLRLRAEATGAALLAGGYATSLEVQQWVREGALTPLVPDPVALRAAMPRVQVAGEGHDEERAGPAARAHLPARAWQVAKDALRDGPVLVQVPRRGYVPALSCSECRTPARCARCQGPMAVSGSDVAAACRWCGQGLGPTGFTCQQCGSRRLRSAVRGVRRSAEEIGRAFPGVPVRTSGSGEVLAQVGPEPAVVIATPGAEPVAENGYTAVLLLDAWASLDLPVLDAAVESLRRWMAAAALARPGRAVVLGGVPTDIVLPAVEALVRWDPAWLAGRELDELQALGLPPTTRMAQVRGPRRAVAASAAALQLPPEAQLLGPMPVPLLGVAAPGGPGDEAPDWHLLVRAPLAQGAALTAALSAMRAGRSARKEPEVITVRVDPTHAL